MVMRATNLLTTFVYYALTVIHKQTLTKERTEGMDATLDERDMQRDRVIDAASRI